jgi:predicted signal transduction protein with EAL and GGDEF domain
VQARELERLGCTHAQGFLFSRPLSVGAAEAVLRAHLPLGPKRAEQAEAHVRELSSVITAHPPAAHLHA